MHNVKERQNEIAKNNAEKYERIISNPYASDEEYQIGAYRESIETQVRDAVFDLQKKGYLPMESGYNDLITGSQYIGINKEVSINGQAMADSINKNLKKETKNLFSEVSVQDYEDRLQIILVPKVRIMPLSAWKLAWDEVVSCIPALNDSLLMNKNSENGVQGGRFRDAQDKIRRGEDAWLNGEPGLAFVGGKVARMTYDDFTNIRNSHM